jgi:hypothetical protein
MIRRSVVHASRIVSLIVLAAAVSAGRAYAFELGLGASGTASTETQNHFYPELDASAAHQGENFGFVWDIGVDGSGSYGSLFGGGFGYSTVVIREGGLTWKGGPLSIGLGKLELRDEVDSPYSLALSSLHNKALTISLRYEDDRFFFSDRWFALNYDSGQSYATDAGAGNGGTGTKSTQVQWPDRSSVVKSYGIKVGDFHFGFQDIIVYTNLDYGSSADQRGPLFDAEYFLNPAPGFLIQYALTRLDSPWQKSSALNDNSILGFFGTWQRGDFTADAQFLVDDFNMNRILHPGSYQNPDKIAWTIGGSMDTQFGKFRFDHAGATRYMFSSGAYADEDNLAYGYTFYPDTEFLLGDTMRAIDPESNYVGYLHGENNIAFMGSWTNGFGPLDASASLELIFSGSKTPANPWGALTSFPDGTAWLNDSTI